jgi:hypothetical protein
MANDMKNVWEGFVGSMVDSISYKTMMDEYANELQQSLGVPPDQIQEERVRNIQSKQSEKTLIILSNLKERIEKTQLYKDWKFVSDVAKEMSENKSKLLTVEEMKEMNTIHNRYRGI